MSNYPLTKAKILLNCHLWQLSQNCHLFCQIVLILKHAMYKFTKNLAAFWNHYFIFSKLLTVLSDQRIKKFNLEKQNWFITKIRKIFKYFWTLTAAIPISNFLPHQFQQPFTTKLAQVTCNEISTLMRRRQITFIFNPLNQNHHFAPYLHNTFPHNYTSFYFFSNNTPPLPRTKSSSASAAVVNSDAFWAVAHTPLTLGT